VAGRPQLANGGDDPLGERVNGGSPRLTMGSPVVLRREQVDDLHVEGLGYEGEVFHVEGDLTAQPPGDVDLAAPDEFGQLDATESAPGQRDPDLLGHRHPEALSVGCVTHGAIIAR
jgi:hypothetical protein